MNCQATVTVTTADAKQQPLDVVLTCDIEIGHSGHHHDPERGDWADRLREEGT